MLRRNLPLKLGLVTTGLAYFQVFSHLEVNLILRSYLMVMPLQIGAFVYVGYFYWQRRTQVRRATKGQE